MMAKRNVLHISKLEDLKKWLVGDGWELLSLSNNPYEVLRASKAGKQNPLIIYLGKSSEHLSFADRNMPVIGAFLRDKKKPQTDADRIRSMTDDELAEWITNMCEFERHGEPYKSIYNLDTDNEEEIHDSYGDLLSWLKAESEG
jgi:hypothetical protein